MGINNKAKPGAIGDVKHIAHSTIPAGWLLCGGQAVSRTTYAALFAVIGTTFGAGDGSTTFNIPDGRGRTVFGKDDMGGSAANRLTTGGGGVNGASLGAVGGGETVTLSSAQMPSHTHNAYTGQVGGIAFPGVNGSGNQLQVSATNSAGSSGAHQNIPPAIVFNLIIKAF